MAQEPLDFFASNTFQSYTTSFPFRTRRKSSVVPGATRHSAIYSTSTTVLHDTLISFLSYINTYDVPILPVTKPDIRTVLGEGASFLVNGCEIPRDYVDPSTGRLFPKGTIVALKRAKLINDMEDLTADRIRVIFNELLTMNHPPLAAHPNIVNLLGVGFETEGPSDTQNAMPVLIPECAELGNLAENLEAARREDRPLAFHEKMSLCLDVLHGMEILHACDIVHGDVKAENILVFEKDDSKGPPDEEFRLNCKLTDFGVSRLPSGELVLGGSRPWQAPECHRGAYLRIEDAKRTDIYSFGMLLWRVCLDGDPFKSLGEFEGETAAERRTKRNQAITRKKDSDSLVQHVCNSLALSDQFSRAQLDMLCEVISITLLKDPSRRELDVRRIIRLLTPDNWFQPRHVLPPARLPIDVHTNLLDLEKWHSEFEGISPVVQSFIVQGYRDYALSPQHELQSDHEEKRSAAAYQLAVCCANGFGGKFHPSECIKWLTFAAERGSQHAQDSLPIFLEAFPRASTPFRDPWASDKSNSTLSSSWGSDFISSGLKPLNKEDLSSLTASSVTFLSAAEDCNYFLMEKMLDEGVNLTVSPDGVSPLHFLSSWDLTKAEQIGRRLIKAGADINAIAERGSTVGGTPLMWSVYGNHVDHSLKLLKLGADTMVAARNGEDALAFAAKLHLADHLRLLLENTRPAHVRGHLHRLIEAAAGGESCFTRINRHGKDWQSAATDTLELLQGWNVLFTEATFQELVISAVHRGILSPYGRMNTDVQMDFLDYAKVGPSGLNEMLRESILSYNEDLLVALLDRGAPVNSKWDGETLLHLCAKIPDHSLAATAFAPRLLTQGAVLDSPDDNGITPCKSWMDAVLERKWDLADFLMREGADARATNKEGQNIMGLCISAINLGAIKFLLKYTANKELFRDGSFMVNQRKQISALQLASSLSLPRSHGMKTEVMGTFLTILDKFGSQLDFRSDGLLPDASAIDIAAAKGNVHAVKALVKRGAQLPDAKRISGWAQAKLSTTDDFMQRKNMERCIYIIKNWEKHPKTTLKVADDWTNLRTIDESKVESSWENLVWMYKDRKGLRKEESSISRP